MKKPARLCKGDLVATISLSGGSAGEHDMLWRYNVAKKRLQEIFGLSVIETPHSHMGRDFIYQNPQARADDLMEALQNPDVKAIFLNQGGDDGIRLLPYIDFDVIRNNPKIFLGFSDGSTFHSMFSRAGVVSYYGPNVLTTLSEPVQLHDYTIKWIKKVLFSGEVIGPIEPAESWTVEPIKWSSTREKKRKMTKSMGYEILQGSGKAAGPIVGGCSGPLLAMRGTSIYPTAEDCENSIVFLEGPMPYGLELAGIHMLRALAATGMFKKAKGLVVGRNSGLHEETKRMLLQVFRGEEGLTELPILINLDCSHTAPMTVLPFGVRAEIDCDNKTFSILESGVE